LKSFLTFDPEGKLLDAEISYEASENTETYFVESRGGKKSGPLSRNPDYNDALEFLLRHHQKRNSILEDILVDSKKVKTMSPEERRVGVPDYPFPLQMASITSVSEFRRSIGNIVKNIGKEAGAKGGNSNKKLLVRFRLNKSDGYKNYNSQELKNFHKKRFSHSGPPPSGNRKGSIRIPSDVGFVYAFWLNGLSVNNKYAIKVGYTEDLFERFKQLNKQLRTSVTNLVWVEHTFFQFSNLLDAYKFEQEIHHFLQEYRYPDEREIYNLTTDHFDQLLISHGI